MSAFHLHSAKDPSLFHNVGKYRFMRKASIKKNNTLTVYNNSPTAPLQTQWVIPPTKRDSFQLHQSTRISVLSNLCFRLVRLFGALFLFRFSCFPVSLCTQLHHPAVTGMGMIFRGQRGRSVLQGYGRHRCIRFLVPSCTQ